MRKPSRAQLWIGCVLTVVAAGALALYAAAGFFDGDPLRFFGVHGSRPRYVAVLFSGDMGLRLGMSAHTARAFNRVGVPVLGVSSSTEFATRKTRAEVDSLVARAAQSALARTHARQVILIGQSFGADIVRVGLADFPAALRHKVAAVVLVVPGQTAFFRADPTGLSYRSTPDAGPEEAAKIDWASIICIRGSDETDSLCPLLRNPNVRSIALPGGHFLHRDAALLSHTIVSELSSILGGMK
jgi:type IV secretory pathway VirJ component